MDKYNFINRDDATNALTDGFCVIFGEKHRKFLTKIGDEIVDLGIKNGYEWCDALKFDKGKIGMFFDMFDEGIIKKEDIDDIENSLKLFFNDKDVENFKNSTKPNFGRIETYSGHYMKGIGDYETLIKNTIKEDDIILKKPSPFQYFKQFGLSSEKQFKSVTLFGEGGLGLDQYNISNLRYYQEENEIFYMIEALPRKYHHLGQLLARQERLEHYIEISKKLTSDINYVVASVLCSIIYSHSLESISDDIILNIQKIIGEVDGFYTHKQISDRIKL